MIRTFGYALAIGAITVLSAQPHPTTGAQAPGQEGTQETIRGVLMDASCAAIRSRNTGSMQSQDGNTGTSDQHQRSDTTNVNKQSGQRSRTTSSPDGASDQTTGAQTTTVGEKYAECRVSPATTTFALHASGNLYILDQASNDMVRQQMGNEAFRAGMVDDTDSPRWMSVTVVGAPTSNGRLSIVSVRK